MKYLLVNHIAARPGRSPGELAFPPAWHKDLIAQTNALSLHHIRLIVATPVEERSPTGDAVSITPDLAGFEHVPIAGYKSARQFLRARPLVSQTLTHAIDSADIVQFDFGGHPVTPALIGEPIARQFRKPYIWVFGSESPLPALQRVNLERHATKRLVGHGMNLRMESFLHNSIEFAALTFTHGKNVLNGLIQPNDRCHDIERLEISDCELLSSDEVYARRNRLLDQTRPLTFQVKVEVDSASVDHALRALAHLARLQVGAKLHVCVPPVEIRSIQSKADRFNLTGFVTINSSESPEADVDLELSLFETQDTDLTRSVAQGRVPIAYRSNNTEKLSDVVTRVQRHDEMALAEAMLEACTDRTALIRRMFDGLGFVKSRTLEASHRRRAAIVAHVLTNRNSQVA